MFLTGRTEQLATRRAGSRVHIEPALINCMLLSVAAGLSHLPFVRATPVNWDSVQFALALDKFDLHNHQPHPPGYVLYIAAGHLLNAFLQSPSLALSLLSVLFSALCVPLFYLMCISILENRSIALGATLLLIGSPLVLYYGSVGLTYMPEMAFSILIGWLAWSSRESKSFASACLLGVSLGIAGGVRQTSLPLLLPLCVWALWRGGRKRGAAFLAALAVTCALWLIPLLILSGGPGAYIQENMLLGSEAARMTSLAGAGLDGLRSNLTLETLGLLTGLGLALVPLGLWAARLVRFSLTRRLWLFLFWWIAPPLIFFALVHIGQLGYILVALPPLLMLSAVSVHVPTQRWLNRADRQAEWRAVMLCLLLSIASSLNFLVGNGVVTAAGIDANNRHWNAVQQAMNREAPATTVLISESNWAGGFREAGYLLPAFHLYSFGRDAGGSEGWLYSAYNGHSTYALPTPPAARYIRVPSGTTTVIALDEKSATALARENRLQNVAVADGSTLYKLQIAGVGVEGLMFAGDSIKVFMEK